MPALYSPSGCCGVGTGTAGIRGRCGCQQADDSMDSRQAAVLLVVLLLITDWGHAGEPSNLDGGQIFTVSERPLPTSLFPSASACDFCSRFKHSSGKGLHWALTSEERAPTTCHWKLHPSSGDLNVESLATFPPGCPCTTGGRPWTPPSARF